MSSLGAYYTVPVNAPAVFHITHHKAGSQWVKSLLAQLAGDRFVPAQRQVAHVLGAPLHAGKVYPTVYLTRQQFESLPLPDLHRRFFILRDLRDTLISLYFGLKVHHHLFRDDQRQIRLRLNQCSVEDGLIHLIGERLEKSAAIQRSWLNADLLTIRYEDLLRNQFSTFSRIFRHCEFNFSEQQLHTLIAQRDFRSMAGRTPGEENVRSHQRKGIAGDWRTHFTPRVTDAFKQRYATLLIDTGYERSDNW